MKDHFSFKAKTVAKFILKSENLLKMVWRSSIVLDSKMTQV